MSLRALILCIGLLASGLSWAEAHRFWSDLTQAEQTALTPLAGDWNLMPAQQQERLLKVARGYAKLSPAQQKTLHSRLRAWARLTPEQREVARENYRKIQTMPKPDQDKIRQQWLDSLCLEFGQGAAAKAAH